MRVVMVKGPIVTAIVAGLAMAGVVGAFASNASPYVTIAQAKEGGGDSLHLAGEIVKGTLTTDMKTGKVRFTLRDKEGKTVPVEHTGARPASLEEAPKVVAVGAMHEGRFVSRELLVKCPSKYGEEDKPLSPFATR
jgi:cytochrome c-type biogenesis protein CcmE